jgi:hypothetical protein
MNLALLRRRFYVAMTVMILSLVVALAAAIALFGFHAGWALWVFVAAILAGFASHGWLMLGVLRDKPA